MAEELKVGDQVLIMWVTRPSEPATVVALEDEGRVVIVDKRNREPWPRTAIRRRPRAA